MALISRSSRAGKPAPGPPPRVSGELAKVAVDAEASMGRGSEAGDEAKSNDARTQPFPMGLEKQQRIQHQRVGDAATASQGVDLIHRAGHDFKLLVGVP